MHYTDIPVNLEKLITPVIICNEQGLVIYKNSAAVQSVRLPRRNTSMLIHLGQTEQGELRRLAERKKPSLLTVQTGDRNARALVTCYERQGKPCSLWVFLSLLQTGSVSAMFTDLDNAVCSAGREICEYVKAIDEFSLALPERPSEARLSKLDRQIGKIVGSLTEQRRELLFELKDALALLKDALDRPLRKCGYQLNFSAEYEKAVFPKPSDSMRTLIDMQSFFSVYLHLILFACDASPYKQVEIALREADETYSMEVAFTLPYPPFFTEGEGYRTDLAALTALSPKNAVEIRLLEAYSASLGYRMDYRITQEAENNMRIRVKLPVLQKARLRSDEPIASEHLFVQHDLVLYFWHVVNERFARRTL